MAQRGGTTFALPTGGGYKLKQTERVVVLVTPQPRYQCATETFAVQFRGLGLTGYGKTRDEAWDKAKAVFAESVQAHRELGTLEPWLNRTGLTWWPETKYDGFFPVEFALPDQKPVRPSRSLAANKDEWLDMPPAFTLAA